MKWTPRDSILLGSNVVSLILPQKRPFLMVDAVCAFEAEPVPTLRASRLITANEAVFEGHFPALHIWPGVLTIEGLGQSSVILLTLLHLRRVAMKEGYDPDEFLNELKNLDRGFRLRPGYLPESSARVLDALEQTQGLIAVGTSVEMKFHRPVLAGQRLDYQVGLTGEHGGGMRFDAEATVEGVVVASGTLMGAVVTRPLLTRRDGAT